MTDRILAHRHRLVNDANSKWWTLGAMCFALFMIMLDNTVVNVALPSIQRDLNATLSSLEWTVNAYTLTFAGFLRHLSDMDDAWRWRFMKTILALREGFPQETWDRCACHPNFHLNTGAPWLGARTLGERVEVDDAVERVVPVLEGHPVPERPEVVPQGEAAGRLDTGEDPVHRAPW